MKTYIDRGIYRETMRRLRLPALTMLVLAIVADAMSLIGFVALRDHTTLYDAHPSLYAIPFVAPYLLTLIGLHFQAKRCDSDFYHALPFTRTTLTVSILAAVASWCAIIIAGSTVSIILEPYVLKELEITNIVLVPTAAMAASLFMMALTFTATQLCGTTVSMAFTAPILLFAPLLIKNTLFGVVYDGDMLLPRLDDAVLAPSRYNLLYGGYLNGSAWLWTSLLTVALAAIGLYIAKHRPSETAGNAAIHPVAQALIRLLLGFVCCLPSIQTLTLDHPDTDGIVLGFTFAVVVYFLYELIITRSAKALLRAIPWLGVLAVVVAVCVVAINVIVPMTVESFVPTTDNVNSISLSSNEWSCDLYQEHTYMDINGDWKSRPDAYAKEYDLVTEKPLFDPFRYSAGIYSYYEPEFYSWSELYNDSRCTRARVKDDACIAMVCEAYAVCKNDLDRYDYDASYTVKENAFGKEWAIYEVVIDFHTGLLTRSRTVYLTETQYIQLLNAVNDVRPLPEFEFNFDAVV